MPAVLADVAPTSFSWHHLNQWHLQLIPMIMIVLAGTGYLIQSRRARNWPPHRTWYFFIALAITVLATQSVVGVYDRVLFADHMIQHLMLIMIAAAFYALSAPVDLARTIGPRSQRIANSKVAKVALHPIVAFALYAVFIPVAHLSGLFNLTLTHELVHDNEHFLFIVVGYLLFRQAFGVEEGVTLNPGLRLVFVMIAVPVDTFTGLALAMQTNNTFSAYEHVGRSNAAIVNDLHLGGAIMWIGGDALMLLALIPITVSWVRYETRRTKELDEQLDAIGL